MKIHAFRLTPGKDLRKEIDKYVKEKHISAGVIISCVGNVSKASLRMANAKIVKTFTDKETYEIVSLVGTLESGNSHLHICIADKQGHTLGGHLKEGTIVGVTAEVIIGEIPEMTFCREYDASTGYDELVVKKSP